ncbi:medium-chain acyl-[acyl-carrier-protein] hydrolase [Parabacteroides sp. PF5-5]|uniref:acyl-[acyl-carrier-protein] thioesterase n=1 Tax=unclassified Parabacteroides TaxID=2649774 RepID=UPI00247328CC|nr:MULTISPECIES: acyl-ACP thioesterase domain-containing protein [unclassified Parabacteroides]MDH6303579.1 medium-chain acyl-[acyl-carrier-protein] hydrolase [Parabacteroides sp. PH5-39]MDH6314901.1 medium-chain acyl-[acyl-carrier-protein] hydrolase [Parabacteroides sp. PF5-13]MDH6318238.1 medium-chain acyl-[acyl-carrier-protein] hydrolase [Parabacteroides sp. PH5-13]MDH6321829.1 medium-chain acyl-[acyl-carrier-protein] hydrolase [Parabacteroides sp. PH5-8]MDH6325953.1 medium-chain acyl-[acyl
METKKTKLGEFPFVTESYLLDFRGQLTIPMIGTYLLHAASIHAAQRGFGFADMNNRRTAWVLSRLAIEMYRYPGMSEHITLYTWIEDVGRLFTSRCFELVDASGVPLGYARSIWAAIDVDSRKPTPLDVEALSEYITQRDCPIEKPGKIQAVEQETGGVPYRVRYSDLDVNGHLNSIKYMEHMLDLFSLDMYDQKNIRRFEISYLSEGRYDMDLQLFMAETSTNKYSMAMCHEDKAICRAAALWD